MNWEVPDLTIGSFAARAFAAILVAAVHSFAAAVLAARLGDPGPQRDGRARLAPWSHLDPLGLLHATLFLVVWSTPLRFDATALRARGRVAVVVGSSATLLLLAALALGARSLATQLVRDAGANAVDAVLVAVADVALVTAIAQLLPLPPFVGGAFWRVARRASGRPRSSVYVGGAAVAFALSAVGVTAAWSQPWRAAAFGWLGF